ncbi:MAG: flagellar biosynthetic protein FliR, partial [Agathobaculum sp.]
MIDQAQLTLFLYILIRMTGFVVFNPLWGRTGIPTMIKSGLSLVFAVTVYSLTSNQAPAPPLTVVELAVKMLAEFAIGYLIAFV